MGKPSLWNNPAMTSRQAGGATLCFFSHFESPPTALTALLTGRSFHQEGHLERCCLHTFVSPARSCSRAPPPHLPPLPVLLNSSRHHLLHPPPAFPCAPRRLPHVLRYIPRSPSPAFPCAPAWRFTCHHPDTHTHINTLSVGQDGVRSPGNLFRLSKALLVSGFAGQPTLTSCPGHPSYTPLGILGSFIFHVGPPWREIRFDRK